MQASNSVVAPSVDAIDAMAEEHMRRQSQFDSAKKLLDASRKHLTEIVQEFGYTPPRAEKSLRLNGNKYILTTTIGTTIDLHDAAIEKLRNALHLKGLSPLFRKLFGERMKYELRADAEDVIKDIAEAPRVRNFILQKFALCFSIKQKTPSLSVDTIESATKKLAKKAKVS